MKQEKSDNLDNLKGTVVNLIGLSTLGGSIEITRTVPLIVSQSNFRFPIFLQPGGVNLRYFKYRQIDLAKFIV